MEINKLKLIYEELTSKIDKEPSTAFDYFKSEYSKLTYEEKEVLKPFILRDYNGSFNANNIPLEKQMCLAEIVLLMTMEYNGEYSVAKLNLTEDVKDVQVAKLFYDLRSKNIIKNSNEEIARALTKMFNLNFDTMLSYLSNPKRFDKAISLF